MNGRKLVLSMAEMNPSVPAKETLSCTQLTEDDHVFVAIAPVFPDCYQQTHLTPVLMGSLPGALPADVPPDFSLVPPNANFDPLQLATPLRRPGISRGRKSPSSTAPTLTPPR